MNYLMHLYLADQCDSSRVGNFLGDFVKGPLERIPVSAPVLEGIRLHRAIDSYSDRHPLIRQACSLIGPEARRVAPIMIDLVFDHYLARHWHRYHPELSLPVYSERFYQELGVFLQDNDTPLPRLAEIYPHMRQHDWLGSYVTKQGIDRAICGVSQRLRRGELMREALPRLAEQESALLSYFEQFLPELVQWSRQRVTDWRHQTVI